GLRGGNPGVAPRTTPFLAESLRPLPANSLLSQLLVAPTTTTQVLNLIGGAEKPTREAPLVPSLPAGPPSLSLSRVRQPLQEVLTGSRVALLPVADLLARGEKYAPALLDDLFSLWRTAPERAPVFSPSGVLAESSPGRVSAGNDPDETVGVSSSSEGG